jgi:hypothetical protein
MHYTLYKAPIFLGYDNTTNARTLGRVRTDGLHSIFSVDDSKLHKATKLTVCLSDCPIAKFASTESGRSLNLTPTSPVKCTSIQCTKLRIRIRASSLQKLGNSSTHASTQGFYPALLLECTEFHTPPFPASPPQCSSPTVALRPPNTPSLTRIHHSTLSLHGNYPQKSPTDLQT